jgi:hypothetical protein
MSSLLSSSFFQDAPYLLEPLGTGFEEEEPAVRLALLTAATKLFFKRPPECQRLLGTVLSKAAADSNQDVHDRGLLYTRRVALQIVPSLQLFFPRLFFFVSLSLCIVQQ